MNGTVVKVMNHNGSGRAYFLMEGENGEVYFGRKTEAIDKQNHKRYCYKGNAVMFEPGEPVKAGGHKTASKIWFENISEGRR